MSESNAVPAPPADLEDALWTAAEVAKYLRVHRNWVYANAGSVLPCVRIGALLRFDPDAIRAFAKRPAAAPRVVALPLPK